MTQQTTPQTTHAVILAAGFGSRLDPDEGHKILAEIGGRPLLDWHLDFFAQLGVTDVTVVTGYESKALARQLGARALPRGIELRCAYNADYDTSNGISVLAGVDGAIEALDKQACLPFWLTMSDHIFDPALAATITEGFVPRLQDGTFQGMLGVDRKLDTIFDMPDANKVAWADGRFSDIGKQLDVFEMVDVGLFWCGNGFIDALRAEESARGDCSTSDAVRRLAARDAFCFWDVGEHLWQDVDTPEARVHAGLLVDRWRDGAKPDQTSE